MLGTNITYTKTHTLFPLWSCPFQRDHVNAREETPCFFDRWQPAEGLVPFPLHVGLDGEESVVLTEPQLPQLGMAWHWAGRGCRTVKGYMR